MEATNDKKIQASRAMPTTLGAIPNYVWSYLPFAAMGLALLIGAIWLVRAQREAKGEADETPDTPAKLLAPLSEAYAAGQMSEEEFMRIRDSLLQSQGQTERVPKPAGQEPLTAPLPHHEPPAEPPTVS